METRDISPQIETLDLEPEPEWEVGERKSVQRISERIQDSQSSRLAMPDRGTEDCFYRVTSPGKLIIFIIIVRQSSVMRFNKNK